MALKGFPTYGFGGTPTKHIRKSAPAVTTVKYNPGYYWAALYGGNGPGGMGDYTGVLNNLRDYSALRGVLIRANWHELEGDIAGSYNFSVINQVYNAVSGLATPKRLCVLLEFRSTINDPGTPAQIVPKYVYDNHTLYGGLPGNGGSWIAQGGASAELKNIRYMCMHNQSLVNRLKALSDAFAAEFDNKVYFEMVQFSEPIVGNAKGGAAAQGIPNSYQSTYPEGIKDWVLYTNTKFVKTIVTQLCNYPQALNTTYIPALRDNGIGVSCPNSLKDEKGLWIDGTNKGIWRWLSRTDAQKLQNVTVIAPHIQKPECYYSNLSGHDAPDPVTGAPGFDGLGRMPGDTPYSPRFGANGAEEIMDLVKSVGANYAFITRAPLEKTSEQFGRNNQNGIDFNDWLAYLARPAQTANPHGGLNNTLPSKLA